MKLKYLKLIILFLVLVDVSRGSPGVAQGGFLIHELSGGVKLSELGEAELAKESLELPVGIPGRFSCRAAPGDEVFFECVQSDVYPVSWIGRIRGGAI